MKESRTKHHYDEILQERCANLARLQNSGADAKMIKVAELNVMATAMLYTGYYYTQGDDGVFRYIEYRR